MREILQGLWYLKRIGPDVHRQGICCAIEGRPEFGRVHRMMWEWPEYSGSPLYPVKHPSMHPAEAYATGFGKRWSGEYGASRKRLVNYLIRRIQAELPPEPAAYGAVYRSRSQINDMRTLDALSGLKSLVAAGKTPRSGICGYVFEHCPEDDGVLEGFMREWPEYSGFNSYPVKHPNPEYSPERGYWVSFHGRSMWTGEYGSARIRLLNYLIRRMEARIEEQAR